MLQSPRGLVGEPEVAALTAKPQKDGSRGGHLSFQGGRFGEKALTTDKILMACLGGTLIKKGLMMLVAKAILTSRFLEVVVELLLATALPPTEGPLSISNPNRRTPRAKQVGTAVLRLMLAAPRLEDPYDRHVQTSPHRQVCQGDYTSDRIGTPHRGRVGEAVTICIAAIPRDWWGSLQMGAKEPAVIHRYSFAEEKGGGGGPLLLLVPT